MHAIPTTIKYPLGSMGLTTDGRLVHGGGVTGGEGVTVGSQFHPQKPGCVTLPAFQWNPATSGGPISKRVYFFPMSWQITGPKLSITSLPEWYQSGSLCVFPSGETSYTTLLEFYTLGFDPQGWGTVWLAPQEDDWVSLFLADTPLRQHVVMRTCPTSESFTARSTTTEYSGTGVTLCPHEAVAPSEDADSLSFDVAVYFSHQPEETFCYTCWRDAHSVHLTAENLFDATWTFGQLSARGTVYDGAYPTGEPIDTIPTGESQALELTNDTLPERHGELRCSLTYRGVRLYS